MVPPEVAADDPDLRLLLALEVLGAPLTHPEHSPYLPRVAQIGQSFQRGLLLYDPAVGTRVVFGGQAFADALRGGRADAPVQVGVSPEAHASYRQQYCPGLDRWACRPSELTAGTDLTFAFEPG